MQRSWSVYNSGSGFSNANIGPGAQYNNNAAGPQYNYYLYERPAMSEALAHYRSSR
ncbi:hypothetical protein B0T09DRAFT_341920 [Sordaria sp. MPI-SDFR-AT-0083]|nr:hypothetical protein B0T09DRAFT_341920 [Sordaria sp. MPI-SDFR-AT-0083]